ETDDDACLHYFSRRAEAICYGPDATQWSRLVYGFMPRNQKEIEAVGELLRRMREEDPAIHPVLQQLDAMLRKRAAEEEQERQREAECRAARGPELNVTFEELMERAKKQLTGTKTKKAKAQK